MSNCGWRVLLVHEPSKSVPTFNSESSLLLDQFLLRTNASVTSHCFALLCCRWHRPFVRLPQLPSSLPPFFYSWGPHFNDQIPIYKLYLRNPRKWKWLSWPECSHALCEFECVDKGIVVLRLKTCWQKRYHLKRLLLFKGFFFSLSLSRD